MKKENLEQVLNKIGHLVYPTKGLSMWPLIREGDNVSLIKADEYFVNDIVLFKREEKTSNYILHRIVDIDGDNYYILGDNSYNLDIVKKNQILAKVNGIYKNTKLLSLTDQEYINYEKNLCKNPKISYKSLINNKEDYLFERLDKAIVEVCKLMFERVENIDINLINCLTCEEAEQLINFLENKKCLYLLGLIVDQLNISVSNVAKTRIKDALEICKFRYIRFCELEKDICTTLTNSNIPFIFLKGSELRSKYPYPYLRSSNDVDLYVDPSNLEKVKELFLKEFDGKEMVSDHKSHISILSNKYKMDIEVHFDLSSELPKDVRSLLKNPFEEAANDKEYSSRYHMNLSKYYLYNILHSAKHTINGEIWVNMVSDTFVLNKEKVFTKEYVDSARLSTYEKALTNVANHFFDKKSVNEQEKQFLRFMYLDTYSRYLSLNKGKKKSNGKFIISRIFVSKSYLISQYPSLAKHTYLLPVYEVRRWFKIFAKHKMENSIKEINSYNESTNEAFLWLSNNGLNEYLTKK